jgi:ABC-type dipeptide/oligopeptide/nickel transport system ATPase subunit
LAREGGFLLHAASAVRDGEAHIFTGRSGAGKTTLSRLAPPDATLLTDEVSYVRKSESGYIAYGTPFAGELAKAGENISAPIAAVYLLVQGPENRLEPMDEAETVRTLMRNILFFAQDEATVQSVFKSACAFAAAVPMYRMIFTRSSEAWGMIGAAKQIEMMA